MKLLTAALLISLTACGAIYTSPKVSKSNKDVFVVELTPYSVEFANETKYDPRKIPSVFNVSSSTVRPSNTGALSGKSSQSYIKPVTKLPPEVQTQPYRLGISDVILLATPTPQTTDALTGLIAAQNKRQGYTIQDDGAIAVPDIGRISLAGQTVEEAEASIFQALVNNQIDPKFSLEIAEFKSKGVSVSGSVKAPLVTPITLSPLTLQKALQSAGGITTDTPEFTTIRIFRNGERYQIPLQELSNQPSLQKLKLQDGDNILVENDFQTQVALISAQAQGLEELRIRSELRRAQQQDARQNFLSKLEIGAVKRDYAYLAGEVQNQGRFPLPFNNQASVADIIYADGGIPTREGDLGQIYILRASGPGTAQEITAYHLNAKNPANLILASKMELRPNDIVFVSEQRVTVWNRVLSQIIPTLSIVERFSSN